MTTRGVVRQRRVAWTLGAMVLAALIGAVVWMLQEQPRLVARLGERAALPEAGGPPVPEAPTPAAKTAPLAPLTGRAETEATLRGVVRGPDGRPIPGAAVTVQRLLTSWPEWRTDGRELDRAFTGIDGVFQFRIDDLRGLLVVVAHPQYAERRLEVPGRGEAMEVRLEPGFDLAVAVTNEAGAPMANARVAVEAIPGDERRVIVATTAANGTCRLVNLAAGPVRLVARHDGWQPVMLPLVVGDQRRAELKFLRPASAPLKGRIVAANDGSPIAEALVETLPLNGKLGLVDTQAVRSDRNGEFTLGGFARGSVALLVRHPDHGASMTTQPVGVLAPALVVELPRRSLVAGRVVVDAGPPLWRGGETLQLRDASGQLGFAAIAADGSFRFPAALSPGWASLRLLEPSFAFQRTATTEIDVRIEEAVGTELELAVVKPTVLRGRLVGEDGQPLAGARLLRTKPIAEGSSLADAAVQLDLGAVGSQVARLFASDRDELLAVTAADGAFEIRGMRPGALFLRAQQRGFGSRLLREMVGGVGSERDLGAVALPRGSRLQGSVLRGGRAFAGAMVTVVDERDNQTRATTITDAAGGWAVDDLAPGAYRVRARSPAQGPGGRGRSVPVQVAGALTGVVIPVEAGRTVRGEVLGSDGQPVAGAIVSVRGAIGASVLTDSAGEFSIELPERAGELMVALADRSRARLVPVPNGDQKLLVQLDTPPTSTIVATVAGLPGQKRLPAAVLRLLAFDDPAGEVRSHWVDLADGELRWTLCPTGRVRVEVWAEGYAPAVRVVDLEANQELRLGDLLLEPGCRLDGVVRRSDGSPVPNAAVMVGEESDLDLFEANTRTAADGSFRITGVSGRSSRLVVRATGFAPRVVDLVLPRDALAATPLPITLEEGASIEVTVPRALAREGGFVQLRRDGRFVANAELGDDGKVVFANRSVGTYTVQLGGDARTPQPVVIAPDTKTVQVRLP